MELIRVVTSMAVLANSMGSLPLRSVPRTLLGALAPLHRRLADHIRAVIRMTVLANSRESLSPHNAQEISLAVSALQNWLLPADLFRAVTKTAVLANSTELPHCRSARRTLLGVNVRRLQKPVEIIRVATVMDAVEPF